MMDGENKFHALLGRALTDQDFRDALMDPEKQVGALESMGIEVTQEVIDALNDSVGALTRLADSAQGPVHPTVA